MSTMMSMGRPTVQRPGIFTPQLQKQQPGMPGPQQPYRPSMMTPPSPGAPLGQPGAPMMSTGGDPMPQQVGAPQRPTASTNQPMSAPATNQPMMSAGGDPMPGQPQASQAPAAPGGLEGLKGVGVGQSPELYKFNEPGFAPWAYVDTQGNLQQMQGYQQGLLEYLQSMTGGNDTSLLSSMIGQGHIDQSKADQITALLGGTGQGLVEQGKKLNPILDNGLLGNDVKQLLMGMLGPAGSRANEMISGGTFSPEEMAKLTGEAGKVGAGASQLASNGLFNSGETSRFNDIFNQVFGNASNAGQTGGVTGAQESDFQQRLNKAGTAASNVTETGGMDTGAVNYLRDLFQSQAGRVTDTAKRGGLTDAEAEQNVAATKQAVLDQGKAAASNTFNSTNFTNNPFAGMALNHATNIEAGKAAGQARADNNKYQADSRMRAEDQLRSVFESGAGLESELAGGKRQGAQMEGELADKAGNFYLGQGGQRLSGISQQGELSSQLQDFLKSGAGGRVEGLNKQSDYTEQLRKIFGENADGYGKGIDAQMKGAEFLKGMFETDTKGKIDAFDSLTGGSKLMNDLTLEAAKYQSNTMPSFLSGLFGQASSNVGGNNAQNNDKILQILKLLQG